jgi:hypothetical protein
MLASSARRYGRDLVPPWLADDLAGQESRRLALSRDGHTCAGTDNSQYQKRRGSPLELLGSRRSRDEFFRGQCPSSAMIGR